MHDYTHNTWPNVGLFGFIILLINYYRQLFAYINKLLKKIKKIMHHLTSDNNSRNNSQLATVGWQYEWAQNGPIRPVKRGPAREQRGFCLTCGWGLRWESKSTFSKGPPCHTCWCPTSCHVWARQWMCASSTTRVGPSPSFM